jgi:hypothetical protein
MFFRPQLTAFVIDGEREFHHWHPGSETVATGSALYSAILHGWQVSTEVTSTSVAFSHGRRSRLYNFELLRDENYMTMPVQENPSVIRFLCTEPFTVTSLELITSEIRAVVSA